jgi:parvulin-like peptidyl-prolyl isomerase
LENNINQGKFIMTIDLTIANEDILNQLKISQMLPAIQEQVLMARIVKNEAEKAGIKIEISELQAAADAFRLKNKLIGAKITQKWLDIYQLSLDDFESIIHFQLTSDRLKQQVLTDKVKKYFYQNKLDFDRVALSEVIFQDKELAIELYYALREGEIKFHDIASKYIEDVELRRKGGYLGQICRKDLNPELLSVFSTPNPPQVIKPITTAKGHHLIWIDEVISAELTAELRQELEGKLFLDFLREKANELIKSVEIDRKIPITSAN